MLWLAHPAEPNAIGPFFWCHYVGSCVPSKELVSFLNCEDVTALVRTALAAGAMRQLALVAVRALGEAGRGQKIVAAALGSPLL